jgi:GTP-binding protein
MKDQVNLFVSGGDGGNGCVSFRREKFVPHGGPNGGDGGRGGHVEVIGDLSLNTLGHLRNKQKIVARNGQNGKGKNQHGRDGEGREIHVPLGSVLWWKKSGDKGWVGEITKEGERVVIARGGQGGRGNTHFATSTNQVPMLAEAGQPGDEQTIFVELQLLADVGIIGLPNAGKSTLLSVISRAKPSIASYPFTTKEPILGVVERGWKTFVALEIPGLLEGAHRGIGLGLEFLRHAKRTRLLLHLLDGFEVDIVENLKTVNRELALYDESLGERPQILVVNKADLTGVQERAGALAQELASFGHSIHVISAATGEGIDDLLAEVQRLLEALPAVPPRKPGELPVLYPKAGKSPFTVANRGGVYVVSSPRVERLVAIADLSSFQVRLQLRQEMKRLGVVGALEDAGISPGDRLDIGGKEIVWE